MNKSQRSFKFDDKVKKQAINKSKTETRAKTTKGTLKDPNVDPINQRIGASTFDQHSLIVYFNDKTKQNLDQLIRNEITRCSRILADHGHTGEKTEHHTVTPSNSNGELIANKFGYYHCYVWVTNPKFYNVMTGRNIDGTHRYRVDPKWVKPHHSLERDLDMNVDMTNWGIATEQEERIRANHRPRYVNEYLGSLQPALTSDFSISHVYVDESKIGDYHNKLTCTVSASTDIKLLKEHVSMYSSDTDYPEWKAISTSGEEHTYTLIFNWHTFDAMFALNMIRILNLKSGLVKFFPFSSK